MTFKKGILERGVNLSNKNSNFPTNQLNNIPADTIKALNLELMQIADSRPIESDEDFDNRIERYLKFCCDTGMRFGIETLALCCGTTRQSINNWANGLYCSKHRQQSAIAIKQIIIASLESLTMQGKINPASSIFYLKNWANYRDSIDINSDTPKRLDDIQSIEEIQERYATMTDSEDKPLELPKADF